MTPSHLNAREAAPRTDEHTGCAPGGQRLIARPSGWRWVALCAGVLVLGAGLGVGPRLLRTEVTAQSRGAVQAPMFEVDPFWPKPLPNHWVLGAAVGVWVDAQDHIWMVHRGDNQNTLKGLEMKPPFSEVCCATAHERSTTH